MSSIKRGNTDTPDVGLIAFNKEDPFNSENLTLEVVLSSFSKSTSSPKNSATSSHSVFG